MSDEAAGQVLAGNISDHTFSPNHFQPWKCADCGALHNEHKDISLAHSAKAVSTLAEKQPQPNEVLTSGTWRLWLGNMLASSTSRGLAAWTDADLGGAVVVAAEGLGSFLPSWASNFAKHSQPGQKIQASIDLALLDSGSEKRLLKESERAVSFIDEHRAAGRPVLVHCAQGKHRSAAVVVAYLIVREGMEYHQAVTHVKQCRSITEITDTFGRDLRTLKPASA